MNLISTIITIVLFAYIDMNKLSESTQYLKVSKHPEAITLSYLLGDLLRLIFSTGFASLGFLMKAPPGLLDGCIIFLFIPLAAVTVTLVDLFW